MSIVSFLKGLFKIGPKMAESTNASWTRIFVQDGITNIQKMTRAVGPAVDAGWKTVLTWGNAFKVAVAGGFTYLFLHGGASEAVSKTLGIDEDLAQILIWIVAFLLIMWLVVWFVRWFQNSLLPRSVNNFVRGSGNKRVYDNSHKSYRQRDETSSFERQAYYNATRGNDSKNNGGRRSGNRSNTVYRDSDQIPIRTGYKEYPKDRRTNFRRSRK